ncbi:MAG: ATP-binding protein [Clostridia bacterium]|nr:ATP-binding protein [Clostridia bacterium]
MELSKHMVDLITNSFEAMAKHILVSLSFFGDWITLEVSDDGNGVSKESVEAAMRGEKAPRGRGLALLRDAAEQSGGDISVWSEEGHGTGVRAVFGKGVPLGKVGDALIVFWQEMPITVITLSAVTENGAFVFDSRLIGERYGDPSDIHTMVKVRKDVNYTLTNLFGGK